MSNLFYGFGGGESMNIDSFKNMKQYHGETKINYTAYSETVTDVNILCENAPKDGLYIVMFDILSYSDEFNKSVVNELLKGNTCFYSEDKIVYAGRRKAVGLVHKGNQFLLNISEKNLSLTEVNKSYHGADDKLSDERIIRTTFYEIGGN